MGGKWSIFASLIFFGGWLVNESSSFYIHPLFCFSVGHILMSVLCIKHCTEADSSFSQLCGVVSG